MSRISGFSSPFNNEVYLNVYDLNDNNEYLYHIGLGFYHTGVQIGREEYTFGKFIVFVYYSQFGTYITISITIAISAAGSGIFSHEPKVKLNLFCRCKVI